MLPNTYLIFDVIFLNQVDVTLLDLLYYGVCSSDKMTPIYFLRLSKVWSMLHHRSVWLVHKKLLLNTFIYFFGIFLFFIITKFVFLPFSFLFLIRYQISATEY